jgi:hypothetical protein
MLNLLAKRDLPGQLLNTATNSAPRGTKPPQDLGAARTARKKLSKQTARQKRPKKTVDHSTDYAEMSHNTKSHKKPKAKALKAKPKKNTYTASDIDVNAVPNPIPDTGASRTLYPSGIIYTGVLPVIVPTSTQSHLSTSGFSPLPPLSAFATSLATTTAIASSVTKFTPTSTASVPGSQQQAHPTAPKHLSAVIIVLLAVGSAFLLLGCYVLYRMFRRPRKHHYPTPSLPILQEEYVEERKFDPEEESLFGGKERLSARPGSDGVLLNWIQYPHVSLAKPPPSFNVDVPYTGNPQKRKSSEFGQKPEYPFSGPNAKLGNRISMMSASVYPGSPVSGNIGLAVTGSPLTADGMPVLQRSNSKSITRRMSTSARGARQSMIVTNKPHVPSTYGTSDLYGGPPSPLPPTPATLKVAVSSVKNPGRARVKAPYAPASLLKASGTTSAQQDQGNPFEESQYVLPSLSPVVKSEDRRERDTKALTSALGLASPIPTSPQTIYPDDSVTLAGDRRYSRSQFMSPALDDSSRLGKLMLGDFHSTASVPDAAGAQAGSSSRARTVTRKRVEEKPPRVPSPPPLPSLAQMALAHSNPQDFEDYRSPTYSIYGLYEADRKSRNTEGGGY